jgi:chloride channel protein, CIC family
LLINWINKFNSRFFRIDSILFGGGAVLVGLTAGLGVWVFKRLIDIVHWAFFNYIGNWITPLGGWTVAILPVLGGLIVGWIIIRFVGQEENHGVAGIMESVALAGGRLRYEKVPAKIIASAISIGSGASVGPEDPSVQIGSALGSMFGKWFELSEDQVRTLVAAGAAAGIAAAFNAPIAGVFFAVEIILGEIGSSALGMVVIAAVTSSVLTQAISGSQPAFHIPMYAFNSALELPLYLVLGLLAGPVSALYVYLLYLAQDVFARIRLPRWSSAAIAGLFIGLVGIGLPQIFGVGYDTIEGILAGRQYAVSLLILLLIAKIIITPISIGGGFAGGVFAPSLFLGATLGAIFGYFAKMLFPGLNILPPAFAMVGMAAVLAGSVHAPLTAILLLFEMTNDYHIILPLMFSVIVSWFVSRSIQPDSAYTLGLLRKGIRIERGRDIEVLDRLSVGEVMQTEPFSLPANFTLAEAANVFAQTRHHGAPVLDDTKSLIGMFTIHDLDRFDPETWATRQVGESCTQTYLVTYPDENVSTALRIMSGRDIGRLPVVSRENPKQMVGLLRRNDIIKGYDAALSRRASLRHKAEKVRLDASTPESVFVSDLVIQSGAICDGKRMKEIPWPEDCIVASVRRGRRVVIPKGETLLKAEDVLVIVAEDNVRGTVKKLCQGAEK